MSQSVLEIKAELVERARSLIPMLREYSRNRSDKPIT